MMQPPQEEYQLRQRRQVPGRISIDANNSSETHGNDATHGASLLRSVSSSSSCLPLPMRVLQHVPGMYCSHQCSCRVIEDKSVDQGLVDFLAAAAFAPPSLWNNGRKDEAASAAWKERENTAITNPHEEDDDELNEPFITRGNEYYDLHMLRQTYSAASPLVVAPMLLHSNHSSVGAMAATNASINTERMLHDYMTMCRFYNVVPNAGVLTTLRYSLPSLRMTGGFGDTDILALAELLLHHINGPLAYIHRLDFSISSLSKRHWRRFSHTLPSTATLGMGSHGALALAKVLQSSRCVQDLYLARNAIGPYGATALFIACASNPTVRVLNLRRCRVGERGALALAEWVGPSRQCGLVEMDLSANFIGFKGSLAIERALETRVQRMGLPYIHVNLEGNLVLQEIMNGITHGLGVLMACVGSWLLYDAARDKPSRHFVSCLVYSASLVVLYISSTLYHSFFILQHTKYIFEVLDKCAIYILIAGSYTPFLQIVLWNDALYSVYLLTFIWVCGFLGICVEAFFPTYRYKQFFSLAMYLGMGWSALICLPEVARKLPEGCTNLMILGGVGYTAGVPFFVRNNNLDHAIWHLFVLAGSLCHWCGIYFYVTDYGEPILNAFDVRVSP